MVDVEVARRIANVVGGRTIATAESCTAGRVAVTLACVAGADEFLRSGIIAYQQPVKRKLLGVTAKSVLSLQCASEMADGVCNILDSDIGVSTTGVAGDDPQDGVEPGTMFIATSVAGRAVSNRYTFEGAPTDICEQAKRQALHDLLSRLEHE